MPEMVAQERNLEEFPFALISKRGAKRVEQIEYRDTLVTEGVELQRLWRTHASGAIGMTGPLDADALVATNVRLHRVGGLTEDGELDLSLYEIVRLLDWPDGTHNYHVVREALTRIGRTAVESRQAFWSERKRTHVTDNIHLWTTHWRRFEDGMRGGRAAERHTLTFSKHYARSFAEGYVSYLDADFYFSLSKPSAKRLLRLIGALAYGGSRWEVEMTELRGRLPLPAGYSAPSKIEEKLDRGHDELYRAGYLLDFRFERRDDGVYAVYDLNPNFVQVREDLALESRPANQAALAMMSSSGIPRDVRLRELREHGPARCYEVAELLPHQRKVKDPVGLFVSTCKTGPPHWWRTVALGRIDSSKSPKRAGTSHPAGERPGGGAADGLDELPGGGEGRGASSAGTVPPHGSPPPELSLPDPPDQTQPRARDLWREVLAEISQETDTPSFAAWFEGVEPLTLHEEEGTHTLTLSVPNDFARQYIESRFGQRITTALKQSLGSKAQLRLAVAAAVAPAPSKSFPGGRRGDA